MASVAFLLEETEFDAGCAPIEAECLLLGPPPRRRQSHGALGKMCGSTAPTMDMIRVLHVRNMPYAQFTSSDCRRLRY